MSPQAASKMLKAVAYFSIGFALLIVAAAWPPLSGGLNYFFDIIDWPKDGIVEDLSGQARLLSAITGGVFASWSVFLLLIVAPGIARGDEEIRRAALTAIIVWFVIDSTGSFVAGFPVNVAFNAGYLILLLTPLLRVQQGGANRAAA